MNITIISVFPHLHEPFITTSLIARAVDQQKLRINLLKFSDFCAPKERIDEPTCGPGAGMILKPDVVQRAIEHAYQQWGKGFTIFFSPKGRVLDQRMAALLAQRFFKSPTPQTLTDNNQQHDNNTPITHLVLVCARYEGIDARVEEHYSDMLLSIGNYVLMGGDIAAQVFLEVLLRFVPGVVGNQGSVEQDSFSTALLDYPEYGLPVNWQGKEVPEIVRSGNHEAIRAWRIQKARTATIRTRFDWYRSCSLPISERLLALREIPDHYVVLLFSHIKLKESPEGNSSIASIDIHDAARACTSYGVKKLFIVSALADQRMILDTFLEFWRSEEGRTYNPSRHRAVLQVQAATTYQEVVDAIAREHAGTPPLAVATSARTYEHIQAIDFNSQDLVWAHNKPVLFMFGTGRGICDRLIQQSDYLLTPINGLTDYNHLSVRSAIAIVLDRWLGMQERLDRA